MALADLVSNTSPFSRPFGRWLTETGLILEIGHWTLAEACAQFVAWEDDAPPAVSVNVSVLELHPAGFAAAVQRALSGTMSPSALILEVTERPPLTDGPGTLATLQAVTAILGLGRQLGLTTVDKGIERPEQREQLRRLGCDLGQGYLLGPRGPRSEADLQPRPQASAAQTRSDARLNQPQPVLKPQLEQV